MTDMDKRLILQKTAEYVQSQCREDSSGHDWQHIRRVRDTARKICEIEGGDPFIVELAALLHDLDDWKFNEDGDETPRKARAWMQSCGVDEPTIRRVSEIIAHLSYKGAGAENKMNSLEGFIAQDADRLDAIGAIGVARAFAYGGYKNRPMYDPDSPPRLHADFEEYKNSKSATVNHFYEKLLLLKDRMNTPTGKRFAEERHAFMLTFLEQFMKEWNG